MLFAAVRWSLLAHRVIRGAATYSVAIGRTADIAGFRRALARSQMTRSGHSKRPAKRVLSKVAAKSYSEVVDPKAGV